MRDLERAQLAHELDPFMSHLLDGAAVLPLDGFAEPGAERLAFHPLHGQDRQPLADQDSLGVVPKCDRARGLVCCR